MKKIFSLIAVAALSATVLAACGNNNDSGSGSASDSSSSASGDVKEITVNAKSFEFSPNEIKVKKGDKVKITLKNTDGAHGLEIPEFKVNLQKDGSAEFTADKAGTFDFDCSVMCGAGHGDMKGKLIVE
ncbi:cupredoxin domain-containing protein [Paenibacillus sp. VCA1]|uniref:cupredoxin domain-containing protein n=1 Tax=Paenibacillus sp. VCA1 TaxID=3039148 RepID=UPI00287277A0|nr:cupredoxin domain-containing protein [Paenibacillus sp. VCA1]MDR9852677.1 cupredoxin domain-containing protein [Paenibacillus sp. VCA1]